MRSSISKKMYSIPLPSRGSVLHPRCPGQPQSGTNRKKMLAFATARTDNQNKKMKYRAYLALPGLRNGGLSRLVGFHRHFVGFFHRKLFHHLPAECTRKGLQEHGYNRKKKQSTTRQDMRYHGGALQSLPRLGQRKG